MVDKGIKELFELKILTKVFSSSNRQALLLISYGVLIGLIASALILITSSPPRGNPIMLAPSSTERPITVYISGEVVDPGVYELPPGSRIEDAVALAGGFLPSADTGGINLAALLIDSSQIKIPSKVEAIRLGKVNINTASADELDQLPGIGPTAAQKIIEYREANGLFLYLEDIQKVTGIGRITYEKIKDLITIGD